MRNRLPKHDFPGGPAGLRLSRVIGQPVFALPAVECDPLRGRQFVALVTIHSASETRCQRMQPVGICRQAEFAHIDNLAASRHNRQGEPCRSPGSWWRSTRATAIPFSGGLPFPQAATFRETTDMQHLKHILVGVDLSGGDQLVSSELNEPTRVALQRARWLAAHSGARLTLFSTLDVSPQTEELLREGSGQGRTVEDAANDVLRGLVEEATAAGIDCSSRLVFGRSWIEIIREVLRNSVDLVIVGTRELGTARRLLFGSYRYWRG